METKILIHNQANVGLPFGESEITYQVRSRTFQGIIAQFLIENKLA